MRVAITYLLTHAGVLFPEVAEALHPTAPAGRPRIDEEKERRPTLRLAADRIPVAVTCRVLGFTKQAFHAWRKNPVSRRDWENAHLTNAAVDAHRDDPTFGYRFITDDLRAGLLVSERRVWRLCSQQRLWSLHAKKRGLTRKAGPPVHDDRVRRACTAPDLDKLRLTDITEHNTGEGTLYLCAVKDASSRRIVGYSIDSRMRSSLAVAALQMAISRRGPLHTVVHSDRGSQAVFNPHRTPPVSGVATTG
ncbi:DDE-type integrase/transposase/recombinase [Curtobacterium sp. TC1]|nr:DDE-type integrase/transposase/recombinase [Curtobacterium sp. TC1]